RARSRIGRVPRPAGGDELQKGPWLLPSPTLRLPDPEYHPGHGRTTERLCAFQPVEPTGRLCSCESGAAACTARRLLDGPAASQEPAMINTKPAAVPGVKGSPSSVTPARSAMAGFTEVITVARTSPTYA